MLINGKIQILLHKSKEERKGHGVKVGPGLRDLGPREPGSRTGTQPNRDPENRDPPQSLKVGPGTPAKV